MITEPLTDEDRAVLAHLVEDPDAWIANALAAGHPEWITAKCRREVHVAAYRAAKDAADYQPRGPLPSVQSIQSVADAFAAIVQQEQERAAAKEAQLQRIRDLFN